MASKAIEVFDTGLRNQLVRVRVDCFSLIVDKQLKQKKNNEELLRAVEKENSIPDKTLSAPQLVPQRSLPPLFGSLADMQQTPFGDQISAIDKRLPSLSLRTYTPSVSNRLRRKPQKIHPIFGASLQNKTTENNTSSLIFSEPGLEEADGVVGSSNYEKYKDFPIAKNKDSCQEQLSCQSFDSRITHSRPAFTVMGSKAKYSQPKVINPFMNKYHGKTTFSNSRQSRANSMVSMEERLSRSITHKRGRAARFHSARSAISQSAKNRKPPAKKHVCLLTCIRPNNLEKEKEKFMKSEFTYDPQFTYDYSLSDSVRNRYSRATDTYLTQATAIMKKVLERYGNYEKFEWETGGQLLTKTQLWNTVKRYLEREGFAGDVVVNISNDLIARAAMTINSGRPTLSIRESAAKKLWVEGLLRHEIGTHHLRFHNNRQQVWHSAKVRRQMGMKPANPTEEGLASLHSVLMRKDPSLWRSAILYYTVYKASRMSFSELFEDLGQYVVDPEVRWDYCIRTKRGQIDTSKPGCFCKDQVYLTGLLQLLQVRHTLDFHLLSTMGKVSHEDLEMLKPHYNPERTKIPSFMQDINEYRSRLDHIVEVNGLEQWLTGKSNQNKLNSSDQSKCNSTGDS